MKRILLVAALATLLPSAALAGDLQRELKSGWLGAWVITTVDAYSDCSSTRTNNRIHGNLVKSSGAHRFHAGELAKVIKVDLKRSRLDLHLDLVEPLLVSYQEGPFTLYREVRCSVEYEVTVPREVVKGKDADAVEQALLEIVERYASEDEALDSASWNEREIEPYPDDYEQTLARLTVWRVEQSNARVRAQLEAANVELAKLPDRLDTDPEYAAAFARGVEDARTAELDDCSTLLAADLGEMRKQGARIEAAEDGDGVRSDRGFHDGRLLVFALEMLRMLPDCLVPVPEAPSVDLAIREGS